MEVDLPSLLPIGIFQIGHWKLVPRCRYRRWRSALPPETVEGITGGSSQEPRQLRHL